MSVSTIIELGLPNGKKTLPDSNDQGANAQWSNQLKDPILINPGDTLQLRNCFLNTEQEEITTIYLPSDLTVSMQIGLYAYIWDKVDKEALATAAAGNTVPDAWVNGELYHARTYSGDFVKDGGNPLVDGDAILDTATVTIPAGSYQPSDIASIITQSLVSVDPIINQTNLNPNVSKQPFQNITEYPNGVYFQYFTGDSGTVKSFQWDPTKKYYFGANQVALDYDEVNNRFQWTYMHTPYNAVDGTERTEAIQFLYANSKWTTKNSLGGIFFADLQPAEFWFGPDSIMGFEQDDVLPEKISANNKTFFYSNDNPQQGVTGRGIRDRTTFNKLTLADLMGKQYKMSMVDNEGDGTYTVNAAGKTQALKAAHTFKTTSNGFYLVELQFNFHQEFMNDNRVYKDIFAIVSKQYNNNRFVSGFSDSSINYTHTGQPTLLSSINIRVLDGNTKQLAKLGDKNYIYIEIFRGIETESKTKKDSVKKQKK